MMAFLTITETGIDQLRREIRAEARQLSDHRRFFRIMVFPVLKRLFREVFRTRGYGRWRPLAASTIAEKRRKGYSLDPLVRTQVYRASSTGLRGLRLRPNVLEITSPIIYAKYHEYGTRHIPKRAVFELVAEKIRPELPRLYRQWRRRQTTR